MEDIDPNGFWGGCPVVSVDPEIVHGEPVFAGTRMPVEDAVEYYYYYRGEMGMSDEQAVGEILEQYQTIPSAESLRAVLSYESARQKQLQPS